MIVPDVNLTNQVSVPEEPINVYSTQIYCSLFVLISICGTLHYLVKGFKSSLPASNNAHFRDFQRKYLFVYFFALFGDWLQGPYIYKLYSHYGYTGMQISVLYIVGFSSSCLFGTYFGALADSYGRKRMCMVFCVTYSLCCFLKIFSSYYILLLGRLLGGISTSLLFSVFESWYVYEHIQSYDFPKEWIAITFSTATYWNGLLAIVAGLTANFTAEVLGWGPVSPFLLAIPCFILSCFVISKGWNENYGQQIRTGLEMMEGLAVIINSKLIFLLGLVQCIFESVMYLFVFIWTPMLDSVHPPLGIVFSVFMVSIMIGSSFYQLALCRQVKPQVLLLLAVCLMTVSQVGCMLATSSASINVVIAYGSFILLEVAVGIYFPAIGYLKSEFIPESHRANVMNWFRTPLNVSTCMLLIFLHCDQDPPEGYYLIFSMCAFLMLICACFMVEVVKTIPSSKPSLEQPY